MKNGLHFISGLPRSGSTLLAALLNQNPRFQAGMSSPLATLFMHLQTGMSAKNEFSVFIDDACRERVLTGLFESYYAGVSETKTVFDTSRMWSGRASVLKRLFPDAKIICCVRPLPMVFDSVERIVRENALEPTKMFAFDARGNIYNRVEALSRPDGMVGSAYRAVKDAFFTYGGANVVLLPYDVLAQRPAFAMEQLYAFLGEEPFEHDFENVEFQADEFDAQMGARGLHKVSGRVEHRPRKPTLPPDLFAKFSDSTFWSDPRRNPHNVRVIGVNDSGAVQPGPMRPPANFNMRLAEPAE